MCVRMCLCVHGFLFCACMSVCVCLRPCVCSAEAYGPAAGGASVWPAEREVEPIRRPSLPAPLPGLPALPRGLHHHRLQQERHGEDRNYVPRVLIIWQPY